MPLFFARSNLCAIKILDMNNPLVIISARSVPQLHWWYNQPSLCHSSTGNGVSQVCAAAPLVIQPAKPVPPPHWWYSQPGLCHNSTGDITSQVCATAPLVIQPARSLPHFCYSFTGFSPWRPGFAAKAVHLLWILGVGPVSLFKCFLCQHHTMTTPICIHLLSAWCTLGLWETSCMETHMHVH
jgi:hypothetical protein